MDKVEINQRGNKLRPSTHSPSASPSSQSHSPYEELDRERQEIRLIKILPCDDHGHVRCHIASFPLHEVPEYQALSYRWGNPDPDCKIYLNDNVVPVRKNLLRLLLLLRPRFRSSYLWIDALCINQMDQQERTHQVALMAQIYKAATRVLVWLGPKHGDSDLAMKAVARDISFWNKQSIQKVWRKIEGSAIRRLCERSYWTRLWVLQELMLAKSIVVLCGTHYAAWESLKHFLRTAVSFPPSERKEYNTEYQPTMESRAVALINQVQRAHAHRTLIDHAVSFSHLECFDPRDKIYALLGIVQQDRLVFKLERMIIVPDYTIGIMTLFNRVLEQDLRIQPPISLTDVRDRAKRLAQAIGLTPQDTFALEEQKSGFKLPDPKAIDECPLEHPQSGVTLWWSKFYHHESVTELWLQTPAGTALSKTLVAAAQQGNVAACQIILNTGTVDVNYKDQFGRTALYYAVLQGSVRLVSLLLSSEDILLGATNDPGDTALRNAAICGYREILSMLLEHREYRGRTGPLHMAITCATKHGHLSTVSSLLDMVNSLSPGHQVVELYRTTYRLFNTADLAHYRSHLYHLLCEKKDALYARHPGKYQDVSMPAEHWAMAASEQSVFFLRRDSFEEVDLLSVVALNELAYTRTMKAPGNPDGGRWRSDILGGLLS